MLGRGYQAKAVESVRSVYCGWFVGEDSRKRQTLYVIPMDAHQLGLVVFLAVVGLPCAD